MSATKGKRTHIRRWIIIIICSLLTAWVIRHYLLESFRVTSVQMEDTILPGDYIWVNKAAYGIKSPGLASVIPSHVFFSKTVERNDIVLYRYHSEVMISRCLGLPGDTLEVNDFDYYINGKKLPQSPHIILPYEYHPGNDSLIVSQMKTLKIPFRNSFDEIERKTRFFSKYELYLLTDALPDSIVLKRSMKDLKEYKICIPKGQYWMLSDNVSASADSRHFGFISQDDLIGKAQIVWFSKDPSKSSWEGYRWNRIFHKISR